MQNLRNTPSATDAWGDSRQFFVQIRLTSLASGAVESTVSQTIQMMPEGPTKPTTADFVITLTLSGLAFPSDRIRIAKSLGQLWEAGLQSLRPSTGRAALISPMGMAQTVSTCSPTASTTVLYWYTFNDATRATLQSIYKEVGATPALQGIPGFADAAFKPMPGPTLIDSAEGGEEPYDRMVDPTGKADAGELGNPLAQVHYYIFKASSAAARAAAPKSKKGRKAPAAAGR